jgi:hypothetical protein
MTSGERKRSIPIMNLVLFEIMYTIQTITKYLLYLQEARYRTMLNFVKKIVAGPKRMM